MLVGFLLTDSDYMNARIFFDFVRCLIFIYQPLIIVKSIINALIEWKNKETTSKKLIHKNKISIILFVMLLFFECLYF